MKVFTVLAMDDFSKRISMEPFSTLELALTRSTWITKHIYGLIPNENPDRVSTGFSTDAEYVVFQDNESVIVSVLEQELREALPNFRGSFTSDGDLSGAAPQQTVVTVMPVDDPKDPTLPAGWNHSGEPVCMETLINDADSVMLATDLSTHQQWALVIARVSKRPNFSYPTDNGVFIQSSALQELKKKSNIGYDILDSELEFLDNMKRLNTIVDIDD